METLTDADGRTSIGRGLRHRRRRALRRRPGRAGAQGIVAAAAIAADLGLKVAAAARPRAARWRRAARFQAALWRLFEAPPFDAGAIDDSAIVCRCEEVTAGELRRLIAAGLRHAGRAEARVRGSAWAAARAATARRCVARMTARARPASSACSRRARRPSRCRSARSRSSSRNGAATRISCRPTWRGRARPAPLPARDGRHAGDRRRRRRLLPRLLAGARGHRDAGGRARRREPAGLRRQCRQPARAAPGVRLRAPGAPPAGNRAADTLPLGPASVALWQEIQRDTGEDLEIKVCGGLMLARERARHRVPQGQDRAGEEPRHRGRADRRQRAARAGALHRRRRHRRRMVPGRGQDQSAASGTYAVVAKAKALGARFRRGSNVTAIERDGTDWKVTTSRGEIRARRIVNTAGPWAAEVARAGRRRHSRARRAAADGRDRAHGADARRGSSPTPIVISP